MYKYAIILTLGGVAIFFLTMLATAIALNVRVPGFAERDVVVDKVPEPTLTRTNQMPRPRQANGSPVVQQPGLTQQPVSRLEFASSSNPNLIAQAKSVTQLYIDDIAKARAQAQSQGLSGVRDFSVQVATIDLNVDGQLEVIVFNNLPTVCEERMCEFDIYQQSARGGYNKIFSVEAIMVSILSTETDDYIDLLVSLPESREDRFIWTGSTYEFSGSLWDPDPDKV